MTWQLALEFIAQIIESLAWPSVIVFLILTFRVPLRAVLAEIHNRIVHLDKVSVAGVLDAEFSHEVHLPKLDVDEISDSKPLQQENVVTEKDRDPG